MDYFRKKTLTKALILLISFFVIYIILRMVNSLIIVDKFPNIIIFLGVSIFGVLIVMAYYCVGIWLENKCKIMSFFFKAMIYFYVIVVSLLIISYFRDPTTVVIQFK